MTEPPLMSSYTIYYVPAESPDQPFLVRRWETAPDLGPREIVGTAGSLEAARLIVPMEASVCFARAADDDPVIIETWL